MVQDEAIDTRKSNVLMYISATCSFGVISLLIMLSFKYKKTKLDKNTYNEINEESELKIQKMNTQDTESNNWQPSENDDAYSLVRDNTVSASNLVFKSGSSEENDSYINMASLKNSWNHSYPKFA